MVGILLNLWSPLRVIAMTLKTAFFRLSFTATSTPGCPGCVLTGDHLSRWSCGPAHFPAPCCALPHYVTLAIANSRTAMQKVDDKFCRRRRLFFRNPVPAIGDDHIFDVIGDT